MELKIRIKNKRVSIGLGWILFSILLVLKLTGIISWSWWLVTSPLWVTVAAAFALAVWTFFSLIVLKDKE